MFDLFVVVRNFKVRDFDPYGQCRLLLLLLLDFEIRPVKHVLPFLFASNMPPADGFDVGLIRSLTAHE